jgi:hypothetical protein
VRTVLLIVAVLALAPGVASAEPRLTRDVYGYALVTGDALEGIQVRGGQTPNGAFIELVPDGAAATPWSFPANCTQDAFSYAVRCDGTPAPLTARLGGGDDTLGGAAATVALTIDGGAGRDTITGGPLDDSISVRDGEADSVDCRAGDDGVVADASDQLVNCERVSLPPPPSSTPPPAGEPSPPPASGPSPPAAAPALVAARVANRFAAGRAFARVLRLAVRDAPAGATLQLRCTGRGCPRTRITRRGTTANFAPALKRSRLRIGSVLEVRVTAPGTIGRVVRFTVAKRRVRTATLCLPPGASAPARCASR